MASLTLVGGPESLWFVIFCAAAIIALPAIAGASGKDSGKPPEIALGKSNRVITKSIKIKPGRYQLLDTDGTGAVTIGADNVTVDFQGAVLASCDVTKAKREALEGIGIDIKGRKNVTIKNAVVQGYKFNIRVIDSENVKVESCDVSYSRADRMSDHGIPTSTWLWLRDLNAWRSYGAGLWVEKAKKSTVRRCRGLSSQNGLIVVDSSGCLFTDNDFSFNSGWGIGLWGSSDNIVSWNLTDFGDRPYGGNFGGDSSSIAVANNCNHNYFVGNSMTHGGDGFFLTNITDAGYDPVADKFVPKGSSDDNVIAYNDGSWSAGNAFEGTFSYRNVYYKNYASDSGYGFWLGFSCDSLVLDNEINRSRADGIAVEQGQGNVIENNEIDGGGGSAVHLWATEGKAREGVPSKNLEIRDNVIRNFRLPLDLTNSTDYYIGGNTLENVRNPIGYDSTKKPNPTTGMSRFLASDQLKKLDEVLSTRPKGFKMYRETGWPKGVHWTQFDDYAPRDFRKSLAAYRPVGWSGLELYLPVPGTTKVSAPDWMTVVRDPQAKNSVHVEVAKSGPDIGEPRPYTITLKKGRETQEISGTLIDTTWRLKWFEWDQPKPLEPGDEAGWRDLFAGSPIVEQTVHNPVWGEPWHAPSSIRRFAMAASTRIKLPAGTYKFASYHMGGLRMTIDGSGLIDNWGESRRMQYGEKTLELAEGEHEIIVQNFEAGSSALVELYWGRLK